MKIFMLIVVFISFTLMEVSAQTAYYTYDDAGNCIQRDVIQLYQVPDNEELRTELTDVGEGSLPSQTADSEPTHEITKAPLVSQKGEYSFTIYPNPTQGQLRIVLEEAFLDLPQTRASFYDIQGKLLEQKQVHGINLDFNLSGYAAGSYILRIQAEGYTAEWQIIKH